MGFVLSEYKNIILYESSQDLLNQRLLSMKQITVLVTLQALSNTKIIKSDYKQRWIFFFFLSLSLPLTYAANEVQIYLRDEVPFYGYAILYNIIS